jgi:hypothetical protein
MDDECARPRSLSAVTIAPPHFTHSGLEIVQSRVLAALWHLLLLLTRSGMHFCITVTMTDQGRGEYDAAARFSNMPHYRH